MNYFRDKLITFVLHLSILIACATCFSLNESIYKYIWLVMMILWAGVCVEDFIDSWKGRK